MPHFLGVDLAAVSSAGVVLDHTGKVVYQFDSFQFSSDAALARRLVRTASECVDSGGEAWIEDIDAGQRFDINAKNVCILQGRIMQVADDVGVALRWTLFSKWSHDLGRVSYRKTDSRYETTASWAKRVAEEYGYDPPKERGGTREMTSAQRSKLIQDYRCGYLIAERTRQKATLPSTFG